MSVNGLPFEVLSEILVEVAKINQRDGATYIFGLSGASLLLQRTTPYRYVRGPASPDLLKWDASSVLRCVCWKWHEWALKYSLGNLYIRQWKGGEVGFPASTNIINDADHTEMGRIIQPTKTLSTL
jgi:hypothetical protein